MSRASPSAPPDNGRSDYRPGPASRPVSSFGMIPTAFRLKANPAWADANYR
jgi:hypothetical protein